VSTHHVAPFDTPGRSRRAAAKEPPISSQTDADQQLRDKTDELRWCNLHGSWDDTKTSMCPKCMEPTEPPLRTEAQIVDAVVKAIQTITIGRVQVGDLRMKVQRSVEGEILTATVRPEISLIFRGE